MTSKPLKLEPVIRKQIALLSLIWAHDQLETTRPLIEGGTLKTWSHRILFNKQGQPAKVEMEFMFVPERLLDEHKLPSKGDVITFKLLGTDQEVVKKVRVVKISTR